MPATDESPKPKALKTGPGDADNASMTPAFFEPAPLSAKEIAELIEGTRWSDQFSWQDILTLAKYCVAYYEPAGTTLVREGD